MIRTIDECFQYHTFSERFDYLQLAQVVGAETFGRDRFVNQSFYNSSEWKRIRQSVIARDNGCDLGIKGCHLYESITVHHINPIYLEDIIDGCEIVFDPQYLITVSNETHRAIHYGRERKDPQTIKRFEGDTVLWTKVS